MKKIIILSIILLLVSCKPEYKEASSSPNNNEFEGVRHGDYIVKTIDSCEYIEYDYGIVEQRVYSLTHKGNCKYCLKRNKNNERI